MTTTKAPNKPSVGGTAYQSQNAPQQQRSMLNPQKVKENWKQLIGLAKTRWSKLTEEQLNNTDGDENKLTGLVKNTYAIPRDEASRQVNGFFAKNASK